MGALEGRVALVTGAARGQGRAHSVALAAAGADVVVCDVPRPMRSPTYPLGTAAELEETAKLVQAEGRRSLALGFDLRDPGAVDRAVEQTRREFGRLDIAVANAAVVTNASLVATSDEAWDELVDTNLTGVFRTLRAVVPVMREQQFGRIVVTSSMGGRMGIPNLSAYIATKWGAIGLAKSLALEVARDGITVNVVCPATVLTPMVQPDPDVPVPEEVVQRFRRSNPIPRPWLEPEDVTRAVMYLVTDPGVSTGSVVEIGLGSSARMH